MAEPDYRRAFSVQDFRGHFTWSSSFTKDLGGKLYHACHEDEIRKVLQDDELPLRSKWSIHLPTHGKVEIPGVWCGLNYFPLENYYGPLLIKFPLSVLTGRSFMVFRRAGEDRTRYFFIQYESRIPIYSIKGNLWRRVKPRAYFEETDNGTKLKEGAIYDIVLTEKLSAKGGIFTGCNHPKCIPKKCNGLTELKPKKLMRSIAIEHLKNQLESSDLVKDAIQRYPDIEEQSVEVYLENQWV